MFHILLHLRLEWFEMSTKVSILDIMRAFHRWDPMDVKQLFAEELYEELTAKDKQIESLNRQLIAYESICGPNGAKELMEKNMKIESLERENQLIRLVNDKLFSEGKTIITQLNAKLNVSHKLLDESKHELHSKHNKIEELIKTNAELRQRISHLNYRLVSGYGKGSVSDQRLDPKDLRQNDLFNDLSKSVQQKIPNSGPGDSSIYSPENNFIEN